MALTGKRELFAHEYLKDLNATQAAIRAGYSAKNANDEGSRVLGDPEVQELIAQLAHERTQELKIDARDVLLELHRLAQQDPAPACNEDGSVKSIHEIPIDIRRAIASFEVEERYERGREGELGDKVVTTKVKFWNKNQALEALGRHLALFKDSLSLTSDKGEPLNLTDATTLAKLTAILEELRRRAANDASDLV